MRELSNNTAIQEEPVLRDAVATGRELNCSMAIALVSSFICFGCGDPLQGNEDQGSTATSTQGTDGECRNPAYFTAVHTGCESMDARGVGACCCFIGFIWNGEECLGIRGCECVGNDCDKLAETEDACLAEHAACTQEDISHSDDEPESVSEDGEVQDACTSMDARGDGECLAWFGYGWNGKECKSVGGCRCIGADCERLAETEEECLAQHSACLTPETEPTECQPVTYGGERSTSCEKMDVAGDTDCRCSLGYAWNGTECMHIGGCECVGADCDKLTETEEECIAQHAECAVI